MMTNLLTVSLRDRLLHGELGRYVVAAAVNNLVGYGAFLAALHGIGTTAQLANVIAYAVGLQMAFLLNRFFVFKDSRINLGTGVRFLLAFAISFGLNQLVLLAAIHWLGAPPELAQLVAMAAYAAAFYLFNKYLVWDRT